MNNKNKSETDYKFLLEQLLHEIRAISHVIKSSSEILSKGTAGNNLDRQGIEYHSQLIFENAYLLSLWLDIGDFEIHPELFSQQELHSRSLWGKFQKSTLSFRRVVKNRNINLTMKGESKALLDCYPIIDILPYLILDNAAKYSPRHSSIDIIFEENYSSVSFEVTSMGPISEEHETPRLFEHKFRSQSAIDTDVQGYGRGLALVKTICNLHNASIGIERGSDKIKFNDVNYSSFRIYAKFNRHA
jgi:light-regulated signal transduction histidine kinase (bacteriophytochrome)